MTNLGDNYLLYENALYSKFMNGTSVEVLLRRLVIYTKKLNDEQKQYKNVFLDNLGLMCVFVSYPYNFLIIESSL